MLHPKVANMTAQMWADNDDTKEHANWVEKNPQGLNLHKELQATD